VTIADAAAATEVLPNAKWCIASLPATERIGGDQTTFRCSLRLSLNLLADRHTLSKALQHTLAREYYVIGSASGITMYESEL